MSVFPSIRIEGGLLGPDILEQVLAGDLPGQKPRDFGLDGKRSLTDEIAAVFADARAQWKVFQRRLERLPADDPATSVTRDAWMIPFLSLLGYELRYNPRAYEVDGLTFAISHRAGEAEDAPPVHIVGARQELGRLAPTGRPRLAPHSLLQEFLNRSEQLWGIVTNGLILRLLRDCTYVRRQAYVEFDLQRIFEEQRFNDFAVLYRLLHRSRLPRSVADAKDCLLERYHQHALEQGGRVREHLRDGVEACIKRLGNGFLAHPANQALRQRVMMANGEWRMANSEWRAASGEGRVANGEWRTASGEPRPLSPGEFYHQLLRLVYRLLFLLVSEDRGLISTKAIYREHYGVARLRRLVDRRSAYTEHDDLWCSLRVLWKVLSNEKLAAFLGAPPLNGELFEPLDLDDYTITNRDFLEAFWHLAYYRESPSAPPRRVNYAALDVEELGSVYESLLDYHPQILASGEWRIANGEGKGANGESRMANGEWRMASGVRFDLVFGSERKSTGSYYTPPELVAELVRSALDPVIAERLAEAERAANGEQRMANGEWRMASGEWRMVPKAIQMRFTHEVFPRLSRPGGLETGHGHCAGSLPAHAELPKGRALRPDQPDATGSGLDSGEHRRGLGAPLHSGVHSVPPPGQREPDRIGDTAHPQLGNPPVSAGSGSADPRQSPGDRQATEQPGTQPPTEEELALAWSRTPFAIRYSLFAEHALLSLRILDPACGSGHFLLAAARRLGKELAKIRTGEDEPAPERVREATRDVIAHCIYGVDKNPLAVELCRVALWLEAHCEGKPLTFLDHRIRCGDSLVGVFDLAVLETGIPDEAFEPASADEKAVATLLKKRNREERRDVQQGQLRLGLHPRAALPALAQRHAALDAISDDSPAHVRNKKELFERQRSDREHRRLQEACDLWTAAFFQRMANSEWRMANGEWRMGSGEWRMGSGEWRMETAITTQTVVDRLAGRQNPQAQAKADALARQHRFFHWPLEFPEVFVANSEWRMANGEANGESRMANGEANGEWRMANGGQDPLAARHSPLAAHYSQLAGFDVVLGNPPWERIKLQEQEFFAARDAQVAEAPTAAQRKRLIEGLRQHKPDLWQAYRQALHAAESVSRFLRGSGQYPLTGRGDINTYSVFAERMRRLLRAGGRAGVIVPTGIATDDTNKFFFADLVERGELVSLFDFENRQAIFPAVHRSYKFCLLTFRRAPHDAPSPDRPLAARQSPLAPNDPFAIRHSPFAEFAFFCHEARDLADPDRRFTLTPDDFRLLNPNTRTAPIFRSRRDAELTKHIYRRVPVLVNEANSEWRMANSGEEPLAIPHSPFARGNPWGVEFLRMFDMANDSHLFRTREELEQAGFRLEGNVFVRAHGKQEANGQQQKAKSEHEPTAIPHSPFSIRYLPLYEAKMIHQFDHRWATYRGERMANGEWRVETVDVADREKADPECLALPRYWVPEAEVEARLRAKGWDRGWLLGWRDITNVTNERTVIAAVIPRVGVGHTLPLFLVRAAQQLSSLLAVLNSLPLDFVARQKVGGTHLTYNYLAQLPVLPPETFDRPLPFAWQSDHSPFAIRHSPFATDHSPFAIPHSPPTLADFIRPRVLELTYTAWDLAPFACDLGYDGPPFRYDRERRARLRAELDALFFLLYLGTPEEWEREATPELKALFPTPRHAVEYILEQFPIVRRKDEERFGEYRTKRLVLEAYDRMLRALELPLVATRTGLGERVTTTRHTGIDRYNQAAVLTFVVHRLSRGDLGRVGYDKVMYFAQEHLGVDLGLHFERKAAGPWDPDLKHKVEPLAVKLGWLVVRGDEGGISRLELGPKAEAAVTQAEKKLGDKKRELEALCQFFNSLRFGTAGLERWATIHKCWKDLVATKQEVTKAMLVDEVLRWKGDRQGYDAQAIRDAIWGMRKHGLIVLAEDS